MKVIAIKWLSASDLYALKRVADLIGFKPEAGYLFRLNLLKCADLKPEELKGLLSRYGFSLSQDEWKLLKKLKGYDVLITLKGTDLVLEFKDVKILDEVPRGLFKKERKYGTLRAPPSSLWRLLKELKQLGLNVKLEFKLNFRLSFELRPNFRLRDYQLDAYLKWKRAGGRGVIVLPVATGKTFVGMKAIEDLRFKTLILVPTIDLLNQWAKVISKRLGISRQLLGIFGGGIKELKDITIMTYDSARLNLEQIIDRFGLMIADECHHAVSPSYRNDI